MKEMPPLPTPLHEQSCAPASGSALAADEAQSLRMQVPHWQIERAQTQEMLQLSRAFDFVDFEQTMAFVNAVADVARQQDHHPDMWVSYSRCQVTWYTHSVGGLSINDFICAAKVDQCWVHSPATPHA